MSAYTGLQLITDALKENGILASGEVPSTDEQNDGLIVLNKLIDSWSAEQSIVPTEQKVTVATGGSGPFTTARPLKIKAAYCTSGNISSPVEICSAEQWAQIIDESRSGTYATKMYCDYAYPTSNIYVWPAATASLILIAFAPLSTFATLATSNDLPPGYARGLTFNLALDLATQFGRLDLMQAMAPLALQSKGVIIATNRAIFGDNTMPGVPLPQNPQAPGADLKKAA
jgi:hypothetical protein